MRAPNLHLPHLHMPHWFHKPTSAEAWMLALMVLLAAAMLLGLAAALSNPGYYAGANGEFPLAPI